MRKLNFLKTLLVAVGLTAGASAWADGTVLTPTQTTQLNAASYDASATSWKCNQAQVRTTGSIKNSTVVITKFDAATALSGKTLTKATLKFHSVCTANGKNSQLNIVVVKADWDASNVSGLNADGFADASTVQNGAYVNSNGADVTFDVTANLSADEDKLIAFGIFTSTGREQEVSNLQLEIEAVDASTTDSYTVNFVDQTTGKTVKSDERVGNIDSTVELAATDKDPFYVDGVKYIYVSDNASSTTIAEGGSAVVTINVKEADKWDWAINAIDAEENVIAAVVSGKSYVGDSKTAYYPRAFEKDGVYYTCGTKTSGDFYAKTLTEETPSATVTYEEDATITYYVEGEDLNVVNRRDGGATTERLSMGGAVRVGPNGYAYTAPMSAGTYTVILNMSNSNSADAVLSAYLLDSNGNFIDTEKSFIYAQNATPGEVTIENVAIPEGFALALRNISTYNSNASIDYLIFKKTSDDAVVTISKEITTAGYATFSSAYALDFSAVEGLTAYIAKVAGTDVTFEAVTKVPANTGVLLKGAAKTYEIPVVASADAVEGNAFVAAVSAATAPAGSFVLMATPSVGFYKAAAEFTVGAGTAYLPAIEGARNFIALGDEATGINTVAGTMATDGKVYNLNGQRVAQPVKGLYIQNGKKVVLK